MMMALIKGTNGNDYLYYGTESTDVMYGYDGDDALYGNGGNDTLYGGNGNDYLLGGAGNDILWGGNDNDSLYGEAGNDTLYGEAGNDYLQGLEGADKLYGGDGNDILLGDYHVQIAGGGNDTLDGGAGDDGLFGSTGADTLTGGTGADQFFLGGNNLVYSYTLGGVSSNWDKITDFTSVDSITFINNYNQASTVQFNTTTGLLTIDIENDGIVDLGVTLQNYTGSTNFVVTQDIGTGATYELSGYHYSTITAI